MRLDHTFHGKAYPCAWGGQLDDEMETISGVFRVDDYQDGAGVLLTNGEQDKRGIMGWVLLGARKREPEYIHD